MRTVLTFDVLRDANVRRLPQFKNKHGQPAHSEPDGSDWSIAQWLQALIGEKGEYANVRKKYDRRDIDEGEFLIKASGELADIQIYLDLLAFRLEPGINLTIALSEFAYDYGFINSRGPYISHFEKLRDITLKYIETQYPDYGPAEWLCHLDYKTGCLWNHKCIANRNTLIAEIQISLSALAHSVCVNLGYATIEKFNEVSERVSSDVFIPKFTDTEEEYEQNLLKG